MLMWNGLAVLVLGASLFSGCGGGISGGGGPSGQSVAVTVKAGAGENAGVGTSCGDANFGTMFMGLPGTQLTVKNEGGTTVGVGRIPTSGTVQSRATPGGPFGVFTEDCVFAFEVKLDGEAKFYTFDLGTRFGSWTMSKDEVLSQGWKVEFEVGAG
jgi:hypothetical protein